MINSSITLTSKCKCSSPDWSVLDVRGDVKGVATMLILCRNCRATWKTKSRKGIDALMDKVVSQNQRTLKELLDAWDEKRREYLKGVIENDNKRIAEIEKERDKHLKELQEINERL